MREVVDRNQDRRSAVIKQLLAINLIDFENRDAAFSSPMVAATDRVIVMMRSFMSKLQREGREWQ